MSKDGAMKLSIRTRSVELTDEVRDLVSKRMQFALDTFGDRIEDTSVYLMDLNGPKGGVDKLCQITIGAHGLGDVVVRETGVTLAAALNRASRRAKYRMSEALRRADRPSTESIRTGQVAA
jgi:putative sigma-54 modulation protein